MAARDPRNFSSRVELLARICGLPPSKLVSMLAKRGVRVSARRSMRALAAIARGQDLNQARREIHAQRMRAHGSRYWVAGFPHLVREWHPTHNGELYPDEVSYGSGKRIWWKCARGPDHEWVAAPSARTTRKRGCPFCANRAVSVTNSLASLSPAVAREWHPTKNGALTPDGIVAQSHRKVWWRCAKNSTHFWHARLSNRWWNDAGCPFCTSQSVWSGNALATAHPILAAEWDRIRNGCLTPQRVSRRSHQRAWWRCSRDPVRHRWAARIDDRVKTWPRGCPFCARVAPGKSFAEKCPDVAREWDRARNRNVTPRDVSFGSHFRAWWRCSREATHRWVAVVGERSRGSGCPYCAGKRGAHRGYRARKKRRLTYLDDSSATLAGSPCAR